MGYSYDYRILNAADFGAYTSRKRFFGIFAQKYNVRAGKFQLFMVNAGLYEYGNRCMVIRWKSGDGRSYGRKTVFTGLCFRDNVL